MRTAMTVSALLLVTSSATAQMWAPTESGNLLWEKERAKQINLVPSQLVPVSPTDRLYTNQDTGSWGTISSIGQGQYLLNEQGEENKLTIIKENSDGSLMWR
jgi:hypothetical protein